MSIISGENLQLLCDVYVGKMFENPKIAAQPSKHFCIYDLNSEWNNPKFIFCYSNTLQEFMSRMQHLKNPFVLVSHNGDENITSTYLPILAHPLLIQWHAQNPMIAHPKLSFLPIGIGNAMWIHGNISLLQKVQQTPVEKQNNIYFYFNVFTNKQERQACKDIVSSKGLAYGTHQGFEDYLHTLAKCKFAICPPGNGIDSHRLWECYYLNVIPIVLKSEFTLELQKYLPCIVLDSWDEFNKESVMNLYEDLVKTLHNNPYLDFQYYVSRIFIH
jgi:hypothetical protein